MIRVKSEARCPETYYEEMMNKDFKSWSKMQLVAFINMNSDENNQVTLRPRKSTLVKRAENIQMMEFTKVKPKWTWVDHTLVGIYIVGILLTASISLGLVLHWIA